MIQQCWDENPNVRPSFAEITAELEDMLQHLQVTFLFPMLLVATLGNGEKWFVHWRWPDENLNIFQASKGTNRHSKAKVHKKAQREIE